MGEQSYKDIENEYLQENRDAFDKFMEYLNGYGNASEITLCAVYGRTVKTDKSFKHSPAFGKLSKKYQADLKKKDDRIAELEDKLQQQSKTNQDNDMEKFKGLNSKIKELQDRVMELEQALKKAEELNEYATTEYDNYIADLENRLKPAQSGVGVVGNKENEISVDTDGGASNGGDSAELSKKRNKGKALELSYRELTEVIRLHCMGTPKREIVKNTGASRGQVDRIASGKLYHKVSRQKVLRAVNHLLKVNQNKEMIKRLNRLKGMYQVDMDEELELV